MFIAQRILKADSIDLSALHGSLNTKCISPFMGKFPCRKCANCLSARKNQWVSRMKYEYSQADITLSFTLTYTEAMIQEILDLTGDSLPVLIPAHYVKFFKKLRSYFENVIQFKYFIKGEYGDGNGRPHYHVKLFCKFINGSIVSEDEIKARICQAWYKGMRFDNNLLINTPYNKKRIIGENPRVNFEAIHSDSWDYQAKYNVDDAMVSLFPQSKVVPPFQRASKHFGIGQYTSQIPTVRKALEEMIDRFQSGFYQGKDSRFSEDYLRCTSFYDFQNKRFSIPAFLKSTLFGGYYTYKNYFESVRTTVNYKNLPILNTKRYLEILKAQNPGCKITFVAKTTDPNTLRRYSTYKVEEFVNVHKKEKVWKGSEEDEAFYKAYQQLYRYNTMLEIQSVFPFLKGKLSYNTYIDYSKLLLCDLASLTSHQKSVLKAMVDSAQNRANHYYKVHKNRVNAQLAEAHKEIFKYNLKYGKH